MLSHHQMILMYSKVEQTYCSVASKSPYQRDTKKLFDTQPLLTASVLPFRILWGVLPGDGYKNEKKLIENLGQHLLS